MVVFLCWRLSGGVFVVAFLYFLSGIDFLRITEKIMQRVLTTLV